PKQATMPRHAASSRSAIFLSAMKANEKPHKPTAIRTNANNAWPGAVASSMMAGLAIIASGITYSPIPKRMAEPATLSQFSPTMPEVMNTVPQTGGVMVDNSANQN